MLGLAQRNIEPAERVDADTVADIDQHRRGLGLDDRGTVQAVAGLEVVERVDRHVAPAAEEGRPLAARRAGAGRRCGPGILPALRDGADGGDAGVDEHDLLAPRGVSVEFFVLDVKAVLDLIDEIFRTNWRGAFATIRALRPLLEKAIALEPSYALPYSALADAWSILGYQKKAQEAAGSRLLSQQPAPGCVPEKIARGCSRATCAT